jgi:hypothetical protein
LSNNSLFFIDILWGYLRVRHHFIMVARINFPIYALGGMTEAYLPLARQARGQGIAAIGRFCKGRANVASHGFLIFLFA